MRIHGARLHNFRNHENTTIDFAAHMNVVVGDNGQGKTNILEALSFLCLTKSFYASSDSTVLQHGRNFFEVEGETGNDGGTVHTIRVAYDNTLHEKKYFIGGNEIERFADVIGRFPIVVLSPENSTITFGGPADRRRFLDLVISQSNAAYAGDMVEYKRAVRQRNRILFDAKGMDCGRALEPLDEILAERGAKVTAKRLQFLAEFIPYLQCNYARLVQNQELPEIRYASQIETDSSGSFAALSQEIRKKLIHKRADELRYRSTLVGPHRDELTMMLNGIPLKQYASQGQHKTFLIALKSAEFFYLKERCAETPVFLLDDVFSELDEPRTERLLNLVQELGQTFITVTSEKMFAGVVQWNDENRKYSVRSGRCIA